MKKVSELRDQHQNEDIYVIGSGPSLGYIGKSFLKDKRIVCVNNTISYLPHASYVVAKEPTEMIQTLANRGDALLVTCHNHSGNKGKS